MVGKKKKKKVVYFKKNYKFRVKRLTHVEFGGEIDLML